MFYDTSDLYSNELRLLLSYTLEEQPEKRWLPAYYFDICLLDGTVVGGCDLRIGHNEKTAIGGNIGYHIRPAFQGHHYAAKACRLLFPLAKKHGMTELCISCADGNAASARTCEILGGRLLGILPVPEDNEMYAEGIRFARVYQFKL